MPKPPRLFYDDDEAKPVRRLPKPVAPVPAPTDDTVPMSPASEKLAESSADIPRDATGSTIIGAPVLSRAVAATGAIPFAAGTPVTVVAQSRAENPTLKAARKIGWTALMAMVGVVLAQFGLAWAKGYSITDKGAVDWRVTERLAEIAGGGVIATAFFAYMKKRDNNPTV